MTDPTTVRGVLLSMNSRTRRAVSNVAATRATEDPQNDDPLTPLLWAIHCEIVDLETEEGELFDRLEGGAL